MTRFRTPLVMRFLEGMNVVCLDSGNVNIDSELVRYTYLDYEGDIFTLLGCVIIGKQVYNLLFLCIRLKPITCPRL